MYSRGSIHIYAENRGGTTGQGNLININELVVGILYPECFRSGTYGSKYRIKKQGVQGKGQL